MCIYCQILFPFRLLQNIEYSSLCYTAGPYYLFYVCVSLHSCRFTRVRLFATLWTLCSPLGSSIHGVLQARILEWVAISSSRGFPHPGIEPPSLMPPALASRFFITTATWEALFYTVYVLIPAS